MVKRFLRFAAPLLLLWITSDGVLGFQLRTNPSLTTTTRSSNLLSPASIKKYEATQQSVGFPSSSPALSMMLLGDETASTAVTTTTTFFQNTDVWVFVAGVFPFAWATVEFWRRILFGEAFGTGTDSVIIGMDDAPQDSRGRRVLGKGALITAYVLFVLAFGTIGIVLYSVISSAPPPTEF